MKRVLTYGTFDLLHVGHINLLRRAKAMGDYLIVGLSTDAFNDAKGKQCVLPYERREAMLRETGLVDQIIPETCWEQKSEDVRRYQVDVFVMGDDWTGKFDYLASQCEVVYLPRTPDISTTELKEDLKKRGKL